MLDNIVKRKRQTGIFLTYLLKDLNDAIIIFICAILRFSLIQKGDYDNKYFINKFKLMLKNK